MHQNWNRKLYLLFIKEILVHFTYYVDIPHLFIDEKTTGKIIHGLRNQKHLNDLHHGCHVLHNLLLQNFQHEKYLHSLQSLSLSFSFSSQYILHRDQQGILVCVNFVPNDFFLHNDGMHFQSFHLFLFLPFVVPYENQLCSWSEHYNFLYHYHVHTHIHDHDHDRGHVLSPNYHIVLNLTQGADLNKLDAIHDSSSIAHYFAQPIVCKKSVQNISWILFHDIAAEAAHL